MKLPALITGCLCALPFCEAVAQPFQPPQGCAIFVTVQRRDCRVENHFSCDFDQPGHKREIIYDAEGPVYSGLTDNEAQWLESWENRLGEFAHLNANPNNPASLTTLFSEGLDRYDFSETSESGVRLEYRGQDRLTGETVVIDEVPLKVTEFEMSIFEDDIGETSRYEGREYVHEEWRMFLGGQSTWSNGDESFRDDETPVTFTFPGEPGFATTQPEFGCQDRIARITPEVAQWF